jgi:hypothetical protein
MLESYNYKKFEVDVLSTYVLTKKILLQLFNKHFNVLELKLLAQDKINNIKNQNSKFLKEIDTIKKDLLSFSSTSGTQNIIGTIKINFPSVYNELIKATLKDGDNASNFDLTKLASYITKIEKYQNIMDNGNKEYDNEEAIITARSATYYDDTIDLTASSLPAPVPLVPIPPPTDITPPSVPSVPAATPATDITLTAPAVPATPAVSSGSNVIIENLEVNRSIKKKLENLPDNAEIYTRVYDPLPRNNTFVLFQDKNKK